MKTRILSILFFVYSFCTAQNAISINDAHLSFSERWQQALSQMDGAGTIIYAIEKSNSQHHSSAEKLTIFNLLDLEERQAKQYTFFVFKIDKQGELFKMTIADSHSRIEPENTVYWLGKVDMAPSLDHLISNFNKTKDKELRKDLVTAVGVHPGSKQSLEFLAGIIEKYPDSLAKEAVFWVGVQNMPEGVDVLLNTLNTNSSQDVKEKVVFALHLMDSDRATQELILLARKAPEKSIRKKALFWLGVQATENVGDLLEETAFQDPETELQKHAVFALSQLDPDRALPRLQKIAREHPNISIRKKAIFWIGQSDDDRAVDIITSLLK
jgi:hypothetical protein